MMPTRLSASYDRQRWPDPELRKRPVKRRLLAIVGPTAVGKSALALELAEALGGEIVSADSRQVYRHMDIGTAKPSADDRSAVPHHLIDVVDPDQEYSLAIFLQHARRAIQDVQARGRLPILAGGTGQYVWGLLEGWSPPHIPPDPELRRRLEMTAADKGYEALHLELAGIDEAAAGRIDPRNVRRVVRALEVAYSRRETGVKPPEAPPNSPKASKNEPPPFEALVQGLSLDRQALYRRIDDRVDAMIESGWAGEVRDLLGMGYSADLPSMSSLGYGQLARVVSGELSIASAVTEIKHRTHRFARNQFSWFRQADERICWSDASHGWDEPKAKAIRWMEAGG